MKQKLLKTMLLLCALVVGGANSVWADSYTLGWGAATGSNYTNFDENSGTVSGIVSFSTDKNSSANAPAYNSTNKQLRLYYASNGNGGSVTLTPASGVTITGFVMTTATTPSVKYNVDGGAATSVSASSKTYTVTGISASTSLTIQNVNTTNTQLQISTIQITYSAGTATPTFSPISGAVEKGTQVTLSCATDGATIYYTTNGDTPTSSSTTYDPESKPVINSAQTIKAIAIKGGNSSTVASAAYTIKKVATPTFSPAAGFVVYGAGIELSCDTEGAVIHYTTDGSTPTSGSDTYSSAISVTSAKTIKAIAIKTNWDDSEVASADYSIKAPDAPTFGTTSGTSVYYGTKVTVSADAGTNIYYTMTTNGDTPADPTNTSTAYPDGGIAVNANTVKIKAIAYDAGGNASSVSSANYSLKNPDAPTFSPTAGGVAEGTKVSLSAATGTTIYYTTDGNTPTSSSSVYSSSLTINEAQTIKAIAIDGAGNSSDVASAAYTIVGIDLRGMYTGYVTFTPGSYTSLTSGYANYSNVTYTGSNSVDYAGWSLNAVLATGSEPVKLQMQKTNGLVTLPPIKTDAGFTIEVTATTNSVTVSDGTNSGTNSLSVSSTTANITISSPSAYAVISYITITPNDGRPEAGLEYETDVYSPYFGSSFSTPTLTNPNGLTVTYSSDDEDVATVNSSTGAVTLVAIGSTTIRASFAGNASYKAGEASYTLNVLDPDITEAPTFSIDEGAVPYGTSVTLSSLTDGAAIYYTTNGDTPTSGSTLYTSAISITDATTIKAIAIKSAKSSTVSTAAYTIANPIAPTFSVAAGAVVSGTEVTLTAPTSCVISYTTDGGDPEDLDNVTDGNTVTLTVSTAQTIKAISIDPLTNFSSLASAAYTIAASIDYRSASKVIVYDNFSGLPSSYANDWSGQLTDNLSNTTSGWERTDLIKSSSLLQMKSGSGILTSPYIQTLAGYTVKVTYGSTAALTLSIGGSSKVGGTGGGSGSQPCTVEITTTNTAIPFTLTAGSGTTYVKSIEITPLNVVTIGSAGYTTFTPTFNAGFPVGVTGFIATATDDTEGTVTLTEVLAVPTGTAVVMKGTAGSYALSVEEAGDCDDVSGNLLEASDGKVTGNGSIFALGVGKDGDFNGKIGFYKVKTGVKVPAGKAYINISTPTKEFLSFDFGDDADAINSLTPALSEGEGAIYNLAGQRLSKMQKGINIVNGKKVLY